MEKAVILHEFGLSGTLALKCFVPSDLLVAIKLFIKTNMEIGNHQRATLVCLIQCMFDDILACVGIID